MSDFRVPMDAICRAFGLAITVTPVGGTAVSTTGVWTTSLDEAMPFGQDYARREPRKVLAIPRTAALDAVPRGSVILAPETEDGTVVTWRADGFDGATSPDLHRVVVVRT
jgi:hypothetical protein